MTPSRPGVRMLARLLIVVLVLVGQFPLRVCTCGADHAHLGATPVPAPAPDTPRSEFTRSVEADPGVPHHHDCPAASPRPCLKAAPLAAVETAPAADPVAAILAIPGCDPAPVVLAEPPPVRPPPVPLFVAFCSLRN